MAYSISSLRNGGQSKSDISLHLLNGRPDTFLPLVELWRPRMVIAILFWITKGLAAALVHTLLCHVGARNLSLQEYWQEYWQCKLYFDVISQNVDKIGTRKQFDMLNRHNRLSD